MSFRQQLIELNSCQEAINWIEDRSLQQAWNDCHRGDWMLWLLEKMEETEEEGWPNEKEIMLLSCWCARRALKYIPEEETRPLKAIEAKEKWAKGEITKEKMNAIVNTTRGAAYDATSDAANVAASTAAYDEETLIQANYFRTQFTPPV